MLAAAVVYFAANDVLACHAIALGTRARTWRVLRADLTYQLVTTGALLVMAPLVVLALDAGSVLVLLLLPPLGAVYANGIMSQRTQHAALHDPLTGLANRTELTTRAARTFDQAACGRRGAAVIVVDLDRFKQANDSYGHQVGDRLLCLVAARLSAQLRPADTAARLGGDEFVILAAELRCAQEAEDLRSRLNAVLTEPFRVDDVTIFLRGQHRGRALPRPRARPGPVATARRRRHVPAQAAADASGHAHHQPALVLPSLPGGVAAAGRGGQNPMGDQQRSAARRNQTVLPEGFMVVPQVWARLSMRTSPRPPRASGAAGVKWAGRLSRSSTSTSRPCLSWRAVRVTSLRACTTALATSSAVSSSAVSASCSRCHCWQQPRMKRRPVRADTGSGGSSIRAGPGRAV